MANSRIHPSAVIGEPPEDRNHEGAGIPPIICAGVRVGAFVTIDAGTERATLVNTDTWLMKHVHIGHDVIIGPRCEFAPGTVVGGWAEIAHDSRIGVNATILPYRKVGAGARIGAGAVVTKDVPAGETWVGNPARKLEDHERDSRPHTERRPAVDPALNHDAVRDAWEDVIT